jgi:hypothetical protein
MARSSELEREIQMILSARSPTLEEERTAVARMREERASAEDRRMASEHAYEDRQSRLAAYGPSGRPPPRRERWRGGSRIQTILFDRSTWTPADARQWATQHGFAADDVHVTTHYIRLRQFEPTRGKPKRSIELGSGRGIHAVIEAT